MQSQALNSGTRTICIASGKGGVGKTTLSINLATAIAEQGKSVLYFDADMGLANAQIGLGVDSVGNIGHVMNGLVRLDDIVVKSSFGVDLVAGASGVEALASVGRVESARIIQAFSGLSTHYDVLMVDCAAGISSSVLAFLQACEERVVVGTAELSSIADAYALLKVMVHDYKLDNFLYLPNQVDNEQQGLKLFESMDNVVGNFLNASLHYVGSVSKDPMVNLSWQKSTPMLRLAPSAVIASNFRQVAKALLARPISRQTSGAVQFFIGQT